MFAATMSEDEMKWRKEAMSMYSTYWEELNEALEKIEDKEEKCVKMSTVIELMELDRTEMADALEKMCDEEKLDIVLKLTFGEIDMIEKHLLAARLSDYKQTLTSCLLEQKTTIPLEMRQIPNALNYGWQAFKTSDNKEERKKLVWDAFYGYVKKDNAVVKELCDAFAKLSLADE